MTAEEERSLGAASSGAADEQRDGEITRLLHRHASGHSDATDRLLDLVYSDLKRIASGQLFRHDATLQTTALVHEAWFKLARSQPMDWESRGHFFAVAARAMRQVVVDHARARQAKKRGGGHSNEPLDEQSVGMARACETVIALQEALGDLERVDERLARVVDCRFFAGYSYEQTADALGVSAKTVQRDWLKARVLLRELLGDETARSLQAR